MEAGRFCSSLCNHVAIYNMYIIILTTDEEIWDMLLLTWGWHKGGDGGVCLSKQKNDSITNTKYTQIVISKYYIATVASCMEKLMIFILVVGISYIAS